MKARSFTLTLIGALLISGAAFAQRGGNGGGGGGGAGGGAGGGSDGGGDAGSTLNLISTIANPRTNTPPSRAPRGRSSSATGTECRTMMQNGAIVDSGGEVKCGRL